MNMNMNSKYTMNIVHNSVNGSAGNERRIFSLSPFFILFVSVLILIGLVWLRLVYVLCTDSHRLFCVTF